MGCIFIYARLRSGLNREEWQYFKAFLQALRDGDYEHVTEDERSDGNDED